MTIIYYEETKSKEEMYEIVRKVKEVMNDEVICLPKNFDILLDCSLDQLISVKGILDTAISMRIQMESPSTEYLQ